VSRRGFVAATGAVAATAGVLADPVARTAYAAGSDRLTVGLVGCGGRGTGAASPAISADAGKTKLV
jgi:myo-inositol 2-dehydrogenase / D-chiro-inositol 1-dehydrogenase